ncbi:hypothetical protein FNF27_02304 [Cafeteria roenbergensis]|uniref:Uncharacterized protein n=1 Tax=Cafeteria roenbergensis TaxID=33653 RepID=A0A5A8EHX0_CAFRO|nr:hypothetical protein FNF27_02304 [Cafeteria roenbergensis]
MEADAADAASRSRAAAEAKVNELERERMVTERAVAVEQARVEELNARLAALNAGLNAEAKKLRDFGPERSVVRNMGANEVHRQLRRERLNRIRFLVDRRQRLLLIHDKTATAIERIRKSINNKRLTQVQTRGAFERKQTELEVRRHKLVLCLEAANAADEERKEATQRRMAALDEEDAALAAYEKEKTTLDEETGRLLRALAGRKTSQERRAEAEGSQHFVGELPIDMEREIKAEIQQSERLAELERKRIDEAQKEIEKVEGTLKELCDRIGVESWEQAVEWWLGRAEAQLALTRRINMVDEEIAQMEERLTEAERGKRRFLRTQRRTHSVRQRELTARLHAAKLVAEEAWRVQERVDEAAKMTDAIGSAVEGAFYAVECNRLPEFREALATVYMSSRQRGHAGGGLRAPQRAQAGEGGAPAPEGAVAHPGRGSGVSRLLQRRTSLFRPGRLQQSEEERLESLLARFADQIDDEVVAEADEAEALALAAEGAKLETEEEAEGRRAAALASAGVGGDFVADEEEEEETAGKEAGEGKGADEAAGGDGGREAKDADDAGGERRPRQRKRRRHAAVERLLGRREDAQPGGVHQMIEMLRAGCTSETMLQYLEAVERTTATLVAELARLRPETVDARPPSALVSEVELEASDDGDRGASPAAATPGQADGEGPRSPGVPERSGASSALAGPSRSLRAPGAGLGSHSMAALPSAVRGAGRSQLGGTAPLGGGVRGASGARRRARPSTGLGALDDQGPAFVRMGRAWGTPLTLRVKPPSVKRGKARSRAEREAEALKELASHARRGSDLPDSAILRVLRAAKREAEGAGGGLAGSSSESSDEDDDAISLESGAAPAPQGIVFQRASVAPVEVDGPAAPRSAGQRRGSISLVPQTPGTASSAAPALFGAPGPGLRITSPPSPALVPVGSRARAHTPDSSAHGQSNVSPLPSRGAVRRMASGRLGAAGSLTPLGGVAPPPSADGGLEAAAGWAPPSPGSTVGRDGAATPSDTPSGVAARLLATGSKYTGAPRKAMSPLDAKGGAGAMQRASRVIVDRAGSTRDLAESLRLRSMSEAAAGPPPPSGSAFGGGIVALERNRSASEAGDAAGGRAPLGTGIDEDAVGSDSEGLLTARHSGGASGGSAAVAAPTGAFSPAATRSTSHRRSHVGGQLPLSIVPQKRFAHARRPVQPETLVLPTPGGRAGPVQFPPPAAVDEREGTTMRRLPSETPLGSGRALAPLPRRSARGSAPPQGELRIIAKPTLHLHKQFRHLPEDPDLPSPVVGQTPLGPGELGLGDDESAVFSPERVGHRPAGSSGSAAMGSARGEPAGAPEGGRWERRGTFAERGDISRAGGRGDDETSVTELAGAISAELRRSQDEQRPVVRVVRPGIDRTTGTTTAKPSSRGFGGSGPRRSSGSTSRHRPATRGLAAKPEAKEAEGLARSSAIEGSAHRGMEAEAEAEAARTHSPMRSSKGKQRKRKPAKRARSRKGKPSASDDVAAAFAADAAGAKADVDDLLGRAGEKHRSAVGAFMRDVDGGGARRSRRRAADATGGGNRLSQAGGRDARAFAVSTAGLGTSKAAAMQQGGAGGAEQGIAALGSVAATLSSQLVEQDIARMAQAARARRTQQHRADAHLLAESVDAGFGSSMASTVATSLGRPSRA